MDDHPNSGPHRKCRKNHLGHGVPDHCRRGCAWPCPEAETTSSDRQPPVDDGKRVEVGVAMITTQGNASICSCGHPFRQPREKVREDAIDRHIEKKHGGLGMRL